MSDLLLLLRFERDRPGTLSLFESILIFTKHLVSDLRLLVATCLRLLLHLGNTAVHRLQVFDLQLQVDNLLVAYRINRSIHVNNIIIVEATQHMQDRVRLTNIGQELVS